MRIWTYRDDVHEVAMKSMPGDRYISGRGQVFNRLDSTASLGETAWKLIEDPDFSNVEKPSEGNVMSAGAAVFHAQTKDEGEPFLEKAERGDLLQVADTGHIYILDKFLGRKSWSVLGQGTPKPPPKTASPAVTGRMKRHLQSRNERLQ